MVQLIAYQIAENTNIKKFKSQYPGELISSSSFELFYRYESGYVFILSYGVVVFAEVDENHRSAFVSKLEPYCLNLLKKKLMEDFRIDSSKNLQPEFSYNALLVHEINSDVIRIAMLQLAQSLALDFYEQHTQRLFDETVELTTRLEHYGKLQISKKSLLKFIGKALNTKNRIIDNLYIFDAPPVVWENELLDKVNEGLTKTFDISIRFKEVEYMLKNIDSNLAVFLALTDANKSHRLEWIIIILILIEVVHVFVSQIFG